MASNHLQPTLAAWPQAPSPSLEERLEQGEVIHYPVCPFAVAEGIDRQFLCEQQLGSKAHKNISYDPQSGKVAGFLRLSPEQEERLRYLLAVFAKHATAWMAQALPRYAASWELDRVSFRPEEEATRRLRLKARNDLLHVDAFPSRPTQGRRILRLFVNINPTEPRVWATSDPFGKLLARFGREAGLPNSAGPGLATRLGEKLRGLIHPGRRSRTVYDSFMLRFHDFLKANEEFQERGPKRFWTFLPGAAWMAFTDVVSHAVLRGRYALEHSYFVAPEALALPQESPPALLERACGLSVLAGAA